MKQSIKDLLKEFNNEASDVKEFLRDVFLIENEKLNKNTPEWRSDITDLVDKIIEKKGKKSK